MTTDIGTSGAKYNTRIPDLTDNADIQAALRIYHYGSDTSNPSPIPANSIAGFFKALDDSKLNLDPGSIYSEGNNLNTITTTGFYSQPNSTGTTSAQAVGATGYPLLAADGKAYAGMLEVVNDGTLIFQKYHMTDGKNSVFWRISSDGGSTWGSGWKQATDESHQHDARYYQKYETFTKTETSAELVKKPTSNITSQKIFTLPADSTLVNGNQVPQGNPTASDGDLWFW